MNVPRRHQGVSDSGLGEIINRHVLKKLVGLHFMHIYYPQSPRWSLQKDGGHWNVLKHPLVLNFVNEKILSCTLFYSLHVIVYFLFLFLLYSYVHGKPSVEKNIVVTGIVLSFIFVKIRFIVILLR